jgi:hypothetical protein
MSIKKVSPINALNNQVATLNQKVANGEIENDLMTGGVTINLPNIDTYQHIPFKAGKRYSLYTTSNESRTMRLFKADKTTSVQIFYSQPGKEVIFTAADEDVVKGKVYASNDGISIGTLEI